MIDELTIYNLAIKYPNTVELVREVEKMAREDTIDEIIEILKTEFKKQNNDNSKFIPTIVLDMGIIEKLEQIKGDING